MTTEQNTAQPVTVALTGASGVVYGLRLIQYLAGQRIPVYCLLTRAAHIVIGMETSLKLPPKTGLQARALADYLQVDESLITVFAEEQWTAPIASGSGITNAMVVCPATMGAVSALATGASNNLLERAADVTLKERKKLIIVPRETPYSSIHLENMLALTRAGAIIMPANPGFYYQPKSVDDIVDFVVARVLDLLDIPQDLVSPWGKNMPE